MLRVLRRAADASRTQERRPQRTLVRPPLARAAPLALHNELINTRIDANTLSTFCCTRRYYITQNLAAVRLPGYCAGHAPSGKRNASVWCPSFRLSVCLSVCPTPHDVIPKIARGLTLMRLALILNRGV